MSVTPTEIESWLADMLSPQVLRDLYGPGPWNCKCLKCGAWAYTGFLSVTCSAGEKCGKGPEIPEPELRACRDNGRMLPKGATSERTWLAGYLVGSKVISDFRIYARHPLREEARELARKEWVRRHWRK